MDNREALLVAEKELERLRACPFAELTQYLKPEDVAMREVQGPSGRTYYIETEAHWEDTERGRLRVSVLVDNGGFRAFFPLACDMVRTPDEPRAVGA